MKIKELPNNYRGIVNDERRNRAGRLIGRSQFWSFGQGYYKKYNGTVVYRHGKRVLDLAQHGTKKQLKILINGTGKQLNLFGG